MLGNKTKRIGRFEYSLSTKKNKKLQTLVEGKVIHFGDSRYEHFKDKTGLLPKKLNHLDKKRRENYLKRTDNKYGLDPKSANYHSRRILWDF